MANQLEILITGKDQFSGKARSAQGAAKGLKGAMGGLGKTVLAAGAGFLAAQASIAGVQKALSATIGSAIKFESAMTKINTLVGISKKVTKEWTGSLLEISKATTKGPVELAEALFVVTSAGERGAEALDVVEASAKASAIGLGETADISRVVTAAVQAFGSQGLDAARATDILVSTVREGNLEASALAGSLGRVLGPAAALGVTFEETGAFIATYTRLGISAEEATTGLLSVMNTLIKPTDGAKKALAGAGLSMEDLRKMAAGEGGLNKVLQLLNDTFGDNVEALAEVIPNVRGLSAVLGTAGAQGEAYVEISGNIADSTGIVNEAFLEWEKTTEAKLNAAMNELNITLMDLGAQVLPLVATAATTASDAIAIFAAVVAAARGDVSGFNISMAESAEALLDFAGSLPVPIKGLKDFKDGIKAIAEGDTGTLLDPLIGDMTLVGLGAKVAGVDLSSVFGSGGEAPVAIINTQGEIDGLRRRAQEMAATMATEVAPKAVKSLEDIEQSADDARGAISKLMTGTTQEGAEAASTLANFELAAFNLENQTGDLTARQATWLDTLNNELIPAQEVIIERPDLERKAFGNLALAEDALLPSQASVVRGLNEQRMGLIEVGKEARDLVERKLKPLEAEWLDEHRVLTTKTKPAITAYISELHRIPANISTTISASITSLNEFSVAQLLRFIPAAHGFSGSVSSPTLFLAGEGGRTEDVNITPRGGGGGGVTIIIQAETIIGGEDAGAELAELVLPHIRQAVA